MLTDNDPYAGISPLLVLLLLLTGGATGNPQCIRMRMCSAVNDDDNEDDDEIDVFLSFCVVLLCTERRICIRISLYGVIHDRKSHLSLLNARHDAH